MTQYDPYQLQDPNYVPPIEDVRVGFGPRFGAFLIDALASIAIAVIVAMIFMTMGLKPSIFGEEDLDQILSVYKMLGIGGSEMSMIMDFFGTIVVASIVVAFAYSLIELMWGTSPGKMTLGLQIARSDGTRGDLSLYAKRWAVKHIKDILQFAAFIGTIQVLETIGGVLGFVIFIGFFFVFSDSRMTLHDRIAQSAVFRKRDIKG
ncbi:MAG: RDD family protein [Bacteroidetes bacterium]|nr:RDD family protein [Bacteroidota bacterium]